MYEPNILSYAFSEKLIMTVGGDVRIQLNKIAIKDIPNYRVMLLHGVQNTTNSESRHRSSHAD